MRIATKSDRVLVGNIIAESFKNNPTLNFIIRSKAYKYKLIQAIAYYAFDFAIKRKGVYISSDTEGVIIFYKHPTKRDMEDYWNQIKLILFVLDIKKIFTILKRDAYLKSKRPEQEAYLYVWFLAVSAKGCRNGTAYEVKNFLFKKAEQEHLNIYAETTVIQNQKVYTRYGFETYDFWEDTTSNLSTWFLKKVIG